MNPPFSKSDGPPSASLSALPAYQSVFESAKLGSLVLREDGSVLAASAHIAGGMGYSTEDILGKRIFEINPHLSLIAWKNKWEQLQESGYFELNTEHITAEGKLFPVKVRAALLEGDDAPFCLMSVTLLPVEREQPGDATLDESQQKLQQERLRLSKFTMDNAIDLIFWVMADGGMRFVNEPAQQLLGYREAKHWNLLFPGQPEVHLDVFWPALKTDGFFEQEAMMEKANGSRFPVEICGNFLRYEGKEYACAFVRDITKRKQRNAELASALEKVQQLSEQLKKENTLLKEEFSLEYNFDNIITQSKQYEQVLHQVEQVAGTDATVLLIGETGTGKELLARSLHQLSERKEAPLIKVNCAALPKDLIESELFGHEKGAFTGAHQQKKGRFELADGGTILLDEIGELPFALQSKLLRVLQEGEFERVGGTQTIQTDVRVIAATNRNLVDMVNDNQFREDLYYRLNVFPIYNLPLRDRREDIPLLVRHFVKKYTQKTGKSITELPQQSLDALMRYEFPGNIRELENIVERAVILSPGCTLNLTAAFAKTSQSQRRPGFTFKTFEDMQRDYIIKALRRCNWRISGPSGAAELLELNPRTLASKMRRLGISRKDFIED